MDLKALRGATSPNKRRICNATDEQGTCLAAAEVGATCRKHYMRKLRTGSYASRQPKNLEDGRQVTFVLERKTRSAVSDLAAERKVSEGTLYRAAVERYLADSKKIGT